MKRLPSALVLGAGMLLCAAACIKENREMCPCSLIVDFSEVDRSVFEEVGLNVLSAGGSLYPSGFEYEDEIGMDGFDNEYIIEVPRAKVMLNAFVGEDYVFDPLRGFVVGEGEDFPALWLHSSELDTRRDVVRDTVRLHKSFCQMTIHMLSDGTPCPFTIGIDGGVCGYSTDGLPEDGIFRVSLQPDDEGCCRVRVPRQKDSSLGLSIVDDGDVLRRFALGHYIERSGFDWSSADLEDIYITIDFSRTEISFRIRNWETVYCYSVEI